MKTRPCKRCGKTVRFHMGRPPSFCPRCAARHEKERDHAYFQRYYARHRVELSARCLLLTRAQRRRKNAASKKWHADHYRRIPRRWRLCRWCGRPFRGFRHQAFCTKGCGIRWWDAQKSPAANREHVALWRLLHPVKARWMDRRNNALQLYARQHEYGAIRFIPRPVVRRIERRLARRA